MNVTLTLSPGESSWDTTFFRVKPGAKINVTANESVFNHTFTIDGLGVNQELPSGKKSSFSFTLPATGPVIFYCIPHKNAGMKGAFYFS